jgi:hypothetical protein
MEKEEGDDEKLRHTECSLYRKSGERTTSIIHRNILCNGQEPSSIRAAKSTVVPDPESSFRITGRHLPTYPVPGAHDGQLSANIHPVPG